MKVIENIQDMKSEIKVVKMRGARVGFVPTMGYLHDGHMSLIKRCVQENDVSVVSTFVNPAQFGPNMDFDRYPKDLDRDRTMLQAASVDYVFHPDINEMYPEGYHTWVEVEKLTDLLDGASRPGYFRSICTVVLKLFNIVECDTTYFGQKDMQQGMTIQKLITDLHLDIELTLMPIVRENDGLAMSSRNAYLNAPDRETATLLHKGLTAARKLFLEGESHSSRLIATVQSVLATSKDIEVDYVAIVDMKEMQRTDVIRDQSCLALAVNLHGTRLIDNIILEPNSPVEVAT